MSVNNYVTTVYDDQKTTSSDNSVTTVYGDSKATLLNNSVTAVYDDAEATSLNNSVTAVYDDSLKATSFNNSVTAVYDDSTTATFNIKTANPVASQRIITGLIQGTTGGSTLQSINPANQGLSSGSMAGVVASILAVVLVVAIIVLCIWKRRSREGPISVWQVARTHTQPKERTIWHEGDDSRADTTRSFNPNIEVQPNNIFTRSDIFIDHDADMPCGYTAPSRNTRSVKNIETAVCNNSTNESLKLRDDGCVSNDEKGNYESILNVRHAMEQDRAIHDCHLGVECYSTEEKKFNNECAVVETTCGDYNLPGQIDEEPHQSEDDYWYMDLDKEIGKNNITEVNENIEEKFSVTDEEGDGDYVAMRLEDDWEDQHTDIRKMQLIHNEQVPEDNYANVDTIRRVQSMYATSDDQSRTEPKDNLPRRIVSDMKRPPKPQPRLSKKTDFDPYDVLPVAIPVRMPLQYHSDETKYKLSGIFDDTDNNSNDSILKNGTNEDNSNLQSTGRYSDGATEILREDVSL